nr:TPA_asm: 22 kDa protein [Zostera ophiovirus]
MDSLDLIYNNLADRPLVHMSLPDMYISSVDPIDHTEELCYDCRNIKFFTLDGLFMGNLKADESLKLRNRRYMEFLENLIITNKVLTRCLFGSWLIDDKIRDYPMNPMGLIVVDSMFYNTQVIEIEEMSVFITNDVRKMMIEHKDIMFICDMIVQASCEITIYLDTRGVVDLPYEKLMHDDDEMSALRKRKRKVRSRRHKLNSTLKKLHENHFLFVE